MAHKLRGLEDCHNTTDYKRFVRDHHGPEAVQERGGKAYFHGESGTFSMPDTGEDRPKSYRKVVMAALVSIGLGVVLLLSNPGLLQSLMAGG